MDGAVMVVSLAAARAAAKDKPPPVGPVWPVAAVAVDEVGVEKKDVGGGNVKTDLRDGVVVADGPPEPAPAVPVAVAPAVGVAPELPDAVVGAAVAVEPMPPSAVLAADVEDESKLPKARPPVVEVGAGLDNPNMPRTAEVEAGATKGRTEVEVEVEAAVEGGTEAGVLVVDAPKTLPVPSVEVVEPAGAAGRPEAAAGVTVAAVRVGLKLLW